MGGLDIPCGDIVQDGVAEDVVFRLPCGNVLRVLSQNDGQFTLVVQLFHEVGMGLDEAAVRHGPGDPLGKVDGVLMFGRKSVGRVFLGLVGVGHVVDAQTDDILRRRGMGLSGVTASIGSAGMPAMASESPARTCGVRNGMASDNVS